MLVLVFVAATLMMAPSTGVISTLAAFTIGAVSAAFGISPAKGWRAWLLLSVIAVLSFLIVEAVTG